MLLPLALMLLLRAPAPDQTVELDGAAALALRDAARGPQARGAAAHAQRRTITVVADERGLELRVRWTLHADEPGWFAGALVGGPLVVESVTLDGRPAAAAGGEPTHVIAWVDGDRELLLRARLTGDPRQREQTFALLPAAIGEAVIDEALGLRLDAVDEPVLLRHDGRTWGGAAGLRLGPRPPARTDEGAGPLAIGRIGIGLSIGDAELRGRARLRWALRRGELTRVAFTATGVGADVRVEGPEVRKVEHVGDRFEVELQSPVTTEVALELSWSAPTPAGDAKLVPPSFALEGTSRDDVSFELARDGDVDVVPTLESWQPTVATRLPSWGRDLVEGQPQAAWVRHGPSHGAQSLQLLRFVPVEAPAVVIERASFELAAAVHGQVLLNARYEVVNERASYLRVRLPARARLLAVEIGGVDVRAARDGDAVLIPMKRSLETLAGLTATPVVLSVLLDGAPWRRRDRRELQLPRVSAPIRTIDAELTLPRDVRATLDEDDDGVARILRHTWRRTDLRRARRKAGKPAGAAPAGDASGTAVYDFEDPSLEDSKAMRQAKEDQLLRKAEEAYNRNDFDGAQAAIDDLRGQGLGGENAEKLESNLMILNAPAPASPMEPEATTTSADVSISLAGKAGVLRRVKDQARARAGGLRTQNFKRKARAKQLRAAGDYAAAEHELERAIQENRSLDKLEQDESQVYDFEAEELAAELEATKTESAARAQLEHSSVQKLWSGASSLVVPGDEHGLGGPEPSIATDAFVDHAEPAPEVPANFGPRVLLPTRGGDTIRYTFDLWGPDTQHVLRVRSRRLRTSP